MDMTFITQAAQRNVVDERYNEAVDNFLVEENRRLGDSYPATDIVIAKSILEIVNQARPDLLHSRRQALCGIMQRLRVQSVVMEVFIDLCDARLIDVSALEHGVQFSDADKDAAVREVTFALNSAFGFGHDCKDAPPKSFASSSYELAGLWLSCMIVRSALAPLEIIFEFIAKRGTLGSFDAAKFRECWPEGKVLEVNPIAMVTPKPDRFLGLHFPEGMPLPLKLEDACWEIDEPLRRCEELFAKYFMIPETDFVPAARILMP
jgi:hypothetical protein